MGSGARVLVRVIRLADIISDGSGWGMRCGSWVTSRCRLRWTMYQRRMGRWRDRKSMSAVSSSKINTLLLVKIHVYTKFSMKL